MNEAKLYGTLLTSLPIVKEIQEKYGIDPVSPGDDQLIEILKSDNEIDWQAVRQDVEDWLRNFPDLLPPDLAAYKKLLDFKKSLPPEPIFDESLGITERHRQDVQVLYKGYLHALDMLAKLATPTQVAIDNIYVAITDILMEFLLTGENREFPPDLISSVSIQPYFGETVVMAMANQLTDPDEITMAFRQKLDEAFGADRPKITKGNLDTARYLAMKMQGIKIKDIADEYIQQHRDNFPEDEHSTEYATAKEHLEHRLKTNMLRLEKTINEIFREKIF
jgi:hypothetical protein